jgi:hypothetical protein
MGKKASHIDVREATNVTPPITQKPSANLLYAANSSNLNLNKSATQALFEATSSQARINKVDSKQKVISTVHHCAPFISLYALFNYFEVSLIFRSGAREYSYREYVIYINVFLFFYFIVVEKLTFIKKNLVCAS